jgi:3-oxoacyl-[acyl-carrier protein] reductase
MTDRNRTTMAAFAKEKGKTVEAMIAERIQGIPARRQGDPAEFGDACAYLCSAQAGYITAQNVVIDGGTYPGTF